MEGLRVPNHREHLSSADEWSEILTSFTAFKATSKPTYKTMRKPPDRAPQTLSSKKDDPGLQTPASQVRSNSANTTPPTNQTQTSQRGDAGLQSPVLREPKSTSPTKLDIVISNPVAVDLPMKDIAVQGQMVIPKKKEVTSSCCNSNQRQSPDIEVRPASDPGPDLEARRCIATPNKQAQEMTVLPSPTDVSDEVLIRQFKKYASRFPMPPGSPTSPLNGYQVALRAQDIHRRFNGRNLIVNNYSSPNFETKSKEHGSPSTHHGTRETPVAPGPPKFPLFARAREKHAVMILDSPTKVSVHAGNVKEIDINDKLERLQREEKWKIGQQIRGIDVHATRGPSPLDFARQGEGNDPKSPIAKEISLILTTRDIGALSPDLQNYRTSTNANAGTDAETAGSFDMVEYRTPSERSSDYSEQKHKSSLIPGTDNFTPSVVDWQHRPWDSYSGQAFTHRFKKWLKTVRELDNVWVDTGSQEFNDANLHSHGGHGMVASKVNPPITHLDLTDQASAAHAHETARGYIHNWNTRLERERREVSWKKQKMAMQMQLSLQSRQPLAIESNPHTPKLNLYLRPIEKKDLPGLLNLFNWYIRNTVRCVDLEPLALEHLRNRIDECEWEKFPALVAAEQKPRLGHALNGENEEIFGCILASDFTGPATINRYTAELELFVDPKYYRRGVGRCLVDKLLEISDPDYLPNHGYHFDCASAQADVYRAGKNRQLARLIFILHYVADDDNSDYIWTKEWLQRKFGFEEQALLKHTGFKGGKWLNSSYLVRSIRYIPEGSVLNSHVGEYDMKSAIKLYPHPVSNRKALATNAILQEKLSWYLDTVEIHLISSISTASTSFFTALGSLQELHGEATASVQKIQALRKDLSKLDSDMALGGLKVVSLKRRRENVRKLADAVCQLKAIITCVSQCEQMVENGDIENALDELDHVEKLTAGEQIPTKPEDRTEVPSQLPETLIDLRGIKALEGASHDLGQLRYRIGIAYERRFLDCLIGDLKRHVDSVPPDITLLRLGDAFQRSRRGHRKVVSGLPTYMTVDSGFRSRLRTELAGLGRARYTAPAATSFKNSVLRQMKSAIRRHLPSSSDDDNESIMSASTHGGRQLSQQEKSSILARNLRALDPDDAFLMLTKIYTGISESLRRLSVQVKVLLDITSGLSSPPSTGGIRSPGRSPSLNSLDTVTRSRTTPVIAQEEILEVLDMSSLLGQAVDIVQSQIVKILKVRSEQIANGSLEQFLRYFSLNKLFADECEAISGRSGAALKNVVDSQIREFISHFSDSRKHRIVEVMDSDRWGAKDFGDEENTLLSRILKASTEDIDLWISTSRIWESEDSQQSTAAQDNAEANGNGVSGAGKDKIRRAVVDEQKYILPESALLILKTIDEFQHLMTGIPSMVQDIALNFLECLKLFNSRSSQLILGAGATRSAGLKNITTKHLALASQALSFITALIPYVREFIRRHHTSASLMAEFDKTKRLYQEHQSGIHEKVVDIMTSRATIRVNSMKKIDWDAQQDTSAVSPYMDTLTQETDTLHRVLAKHLPETTVMTIMDPVFTNYRDQWTKAFQVAPLKTESGKQRMLSDVEYFKAKIDKIDGSGDLGDHLVRIVQAKSVASSPKPESPPPHPPAPDTPAPDTPAPDTPAPDTPAPDTPAQDSDHPSQQAEENGTPKSDES
ncbi:hypothetical protein ACJ72_03448 [Emergomyces africanus]|uniref:Vacuolar protein sorting-associated protein 54 n=1 Tax=Emergomyces africanus TaxID=1955775 RepID=A0A1B7NZK5_9EURO|nr:hypothetical protein ACJ72_03448 [Emergomyces africanus]